MAYRTPANVKQEFSAHPRRALVITTVVHESRAVKAHLAKPEILIGEKGALYEYGRFADPAGEWLVVHAITPQGNSDAGLVASKAHQEFGNFHAQMFVGVAGSLKADIPIGSVVVGDYVYNAQAAKVEDKETLARPHGLVAARELLTASQGLIYSDEWKDLIRPPAGMELPSADKYPCGFPPVAVIKGIASGEEVVAGGKSARYVWLRSHFNDCGAVEMEGWGAMNAARYENTSAIVVRGISDMCAGKDYATDELHQPIAAAHAAAFAFSILSFRSKVPAMQGSIDQEVKQQDSAPTSMTPSAEDPRVHFVFNFAGSTDGWSKEKVDQVVERLKQAIEDEKLTLIRIDVGSVRLVMNVRESDISAIDLAKLRRAAEASGVTLLGATTVDSVREADKAREALAAASADLLGWEKTLPNGVWMERPERQNIEARLHLETSSTVLLGQAGSGKSALLSKMASELVADGATVFALKADLLSPDLRTEADLQRELELPALPSDLILRVAVLQPVFVFVDQLDALASYLDLKSGRLNVLLNLIRRIGGAQNVHVVLSARTFEYHHDVRLRAIEAEGVTLELPPWHDIKDRLAEVGVEADAWPEKARDVVRIPQALKTFIGLVRAGRAEPFTTYQAMLEQLWRDRVASADDSENLIALASNLAERMAEEETLWLAASRFDDRLNALKRLEALGIIVRSENNLSVSFSHQTIFEYVLARTFVRSAGLLAGYVLERQNSLFVRAKVWAALNYLREAEPKSYEREFLKIWDCQDLRRHLRLLLIEFLGQVRNPMEFERKCMAGALKDSELRIFGLKAIGSSATWFTHFASTAISDAMSSSNPEVAQSLRILSLNWKTHSDRVINLIKERWLPYPEKDGYSWAAVHDCPLWTSEVEEIAAVVIRRTPISIWQVDHTAATVAVVQPDVALRLVRNKLDHLLAEAKRAPAPPPYPVDGTHQEKMSWHFQHSPSKQFERLLDASEWTDLPSLAEAAPSAFLRHLWPWYLEVFSEMLSHKNSEDVKYMFRGQYILEMELTDSETRLGVRDKPVMSALQVAIEGVSQKAPADFAVWADQNSKVELLPVQQLIAHGYALAPGDFASTALEWILADERRFQLGTSHGHRRTTVGLVQACAPHWSNGAITRFEKVVLGYRPPIPGHLKEAGQRKVFADVVRATKKDLLQAVGIERLAPETRELVASEQRALGDRFDRSVGDVEGGFIGSPMEATAMAKAKDRDILKIFREIPDNTQWDHPKHWMRGGNIQLSRAFAEFAKADPLRAVRLLEQFEPLQQERAAAYALESMAEDNGNDARVIEAFLDLHARAFGAAEFRASAARAIEKIANRKVDVSDAVTNVLIGWLGEAPSSEEEKNTERRETDSQEKEADLKDGSILWGLGSASALPGGNFNILSALASILLNRKEAGRDRYFSILNDHLSRELDPNVWKALLYRLTNAGGSTPEIVSTFLRKLFARFPEILPTRDAVIFLAYAQRWDDKLVFDVIAQWRTSGQAFLQRAYGELVGLVALVKGRAEWLARLDEIVASETEEAKIGLAHAAVNVWNDAKTRRRATAVLIALLKGRGKEVVAAVMDVFRITDELEADVSTNELLRALAASDMDMSAAPSHFVVERLQALLPHEAESVGMIAENLVAAWRGELGDIRTGTAIAAPQLTDLALTLHRLGGSARDVGVRIFEEMIEIDAYGARETLAEIDGRFDLQQTVARQRLPRRRRRSRTPNR